jgi:hypothetical protein
LNTGLSLSANDLRHAIMIAQVDEQHAAMVALAVHPARKADDLWPTWAGRGSAQVWVRYACMMIVSGLVVRDK